MVRIVDSIYFVDLVMVGIGNGFTCRLLRVEKATVFLARGRPKDSMLLDGKGITMRRFVRSS